MNESCLAAVCTPHLVSWRRHVTFFQIWVFVDGLVDAAFCHYNCAWGQSNDLGRLCFVLLPAVLQLGLSNYLLLRLFLGLLLCCLASLLVSLHPCLALSLSLYRSPSLSIPLSCSGEPQERSVHEVISWCFPCLRCSIQTDCGM